MSNLEKVVADIRAQAQSHTVGLNGWGGCMLHQKSVVQEYAATCQVADIHPNSSYLFFGTIPYCHLQHARVAEEGSAVNGKHTVTCLHIRG